MRTAQDIRNDFLNFFREKQHQIVDSSPVVATGDKSLLFTNAGMNQFKDVFLGTGTRPYTKVANTQKCLRVSGKHNDLEEVGLDTYHHTFFEMLGNWSFGDYFKKEAISWAWQLLTEVWKIPKEKLWVTVFAGDKEDGLEADEEAEKLWREETDISPERILRFDKKDNFWEMGDTGPCGPCSEIHVDLGPGASDGKGEEGVNGTDGRYVEIWNLVFIQFNRTADGKLTTLPQKHVDTGMGYERLVSVLQNKSSNYDTDLFAPIMAHLESLTGKKYTSGTSQTDIAFRVIADHIRALCVSFADGVLPGNSDQGYVTKRLLRRASRYAHEALSLEDPVLYKLVPTVAEIYKNVFKEIEQRIDHISLLVRKQEESFNETLARGVVLFQDLVKEVHQKQEKVISGEKAYELYQRDGFPKDLIELMAREQNLGLDEQGWKKAEEKHKEDSKGEKASMAWTSQLVGVAATRFIGYNQFETHAKIAKFIDKDKVILDRTVFYAEGGGQVGDTGTISGKDFEFCVEDTQKEEGVFIHFGKLIKGDTHQFPKWVNAKIDKERRLKIMSNHTATHLLHWGLREILGKNVRQLGSLVAPNRLRFDVSHANKINEEQLNKVEALVNNVIAENIRVRSRVESKDKAEAKGAIAFFDEKYGEKVRVITIGRYSMELCGGAHVFFTGNLGCFKIVSEGNQGDGVRRLVAVTRNAAIAQMQKTQRTLNQVKSQLKVGDEEQLATRIATLQEEVKKLKKKDRQDIQKDMAAKRDELLSQTKDSQGCKVIVVMENEIAPNDLRNLADLLRKSNTPCVGILTTKQKDKVFFVTFSSQQMCEKGFHAGELVKKLSFFIGGGGNTKRADFSQGQGTNADGLKNALEQIAKEIENKLLN